MTSRQAQFLQPNEVIMKATQVAQSNTKSPIHLYTCVIPGCKNTFELPYGRWEDGEVCSKKCNDAKRKLVEDSFEMHHGLKAA